VINSINVCLDCTALNRQRVHSLSTLSESWPSRIKTPVNASVFCEKGNHSSYITGQLCTNTRAQFKSALSLGDFVVLEHWERRAPRFCLLQRAHAPLYNQTFLAPNSVQLMFNVPSIWLTPEKLCTRRRRSILIHISFITFMYMK
jgi:hypothetical protein